MRDRKKKLDMAQKKKEGVKKIEDDIKDNLKTRISEFKTTLEQQVISHKEELKNDPVKRAQFFDICYECGVDPFVSHKSLFDIFSNQADYYIELSIQLSELIVYNKQSNAGYFKVSDTILALNQMRGSQSEKVSEQDLKQALAQLRPMLGSKRLEIEKLNGVDQIIFSNSSDEEDLANRMMHLIQQNQGKQDKDVYIQSNRQFNPEGHKQVKNILINLKGGWLDEKGDAVYIPSLSKGLQMYK